MKTSFKTAVLVTVALGLAAIPFETHAATQLLVNGGFETGTFAGWTVTDLAGGSGTFSIDTPGTTTPISGMTAVGSAANGLFYAVSDQGGPGTHSLLQSFTVGAGSSVILDFDMFVNDYDAGPIVNPAGLNHTAGPNQHARVDILTSGAGAFDTGAGVLANFYLGVDAGVDPHAFTHYSFDISSIVGAGGTYKIRFAEVDNQLFLNQGVDNVSIVATSSVPDSGSTIAMLGLTLAGVAAVRRKLGVA